MTNEQQHDQRKELSRLAYEAIKFSGLFRSIANERADELAEEIAKKLDTELSRLIDEELDKLEARKAAA